MKIATTLRPVSRSGRASGALQVDTNVVEEQKPDASARAIRAGRNPIRVFVMTMLLAYDQRPICHWSWIGEIPGLKEWSPRDPARGSRRCFRLHAHGLSSIPTKAD